MIMVTSGLHRAPVSASEHRSSTGTSTCDRQRILSIACVQVRGLLRVRRQGLEPRTRGLRARTRSYRPGSACASSCRSRRSATSRRAVGCRPMPPRSTATEHRWSTATGQSVLHRRTRWGSGATAEAADFRSAGHRRVPVRRRRTRVGERKTAVSCDGQRMPCGGPDGVGRSSAGW